MSTTTLKAWYWVHKWTSLICTVFLLMLCITGLPLIFYHEIDHWLGNAAEPPDMPVDTPRISVDRIVEAARAQRPDDAVQFVSREPDEPHVWFVVLGKTPDAQEASAFYTYDARTGELLLDYPLDQGFMHFMFTLHVDLFAGLPGTLFLGFMGLLFVASMVSGVVVYGPFMRKLPFGTVRRERAARTKWLDLHNLLGITTLVWASVVGITGVVNTLAWPILGYWQYTELADMTASYRGKPPLIGVGSTQQAITAARAAEPGMDLSFIAFPGTLFSSPHHFTAYMTGTTPLTSKLLKPVLIDAQTSAITAQRELPWYVTALLVSQPLHFGDYGGMPLKILWALLDVLTIIVLGSGLYLWLKRRNISVEEWLHDVQPEASDAVVSFPAVPQRESA